MSLEGILFYLLAFTALIMAVFVVTARSAVHSALFLISTLVTVAGLFVLLRAEFIMGVQILVYIGGVMVLFLFVIMLVNVKEEEKESTRIFTKQYVPAVILAFLLGGAVLFLVRASSETGFFREADQAAVTANVAAPAVTATQAGQDSRNTQTLGETLYTKAALPFEIASVLLLVAIIGSVLLARGRKQEKLFD